MGAGMAVLLAAGLCNGTGQESPGDPQLRWELIVERWVSRDQDYEAMTQGGIGLTGSFRHFDVGIGVSGGTIDLVPFSRADFIVKDTRIIELSIFTRAYFTPPESRIRPYATAQLGFVLASWQYRDPDVLGPEYVCYDDGYCCYCDYEDDDLDSTAGIGAYAGLGVAFQLSRRVNLFVEGGVGGVTFMGDTFEGISNDFLNDFSYAGVKVGLSFSF